MQRFGLNPDQAFAVLVRFAQHHNRKLLSIATDMVANGLPSDMSPIRDTP